VRGMDYDLPFTRLAPFGARHPLPAHAGRGYEPAAPPSTDRLKSNLRQPCYCGTTPSRPTLMRGASKVPSGFFTAAITVKLAPGFSSLALPIS